MAHRDHISHKLPYMQQQRQQSERLMNHHHSEVFPQAYGTDATKPPDVERAPAWMLGNHHLPDGSFLHLQPSAGCPSSSSTHELEEGTGGRQRWWSPYAKTDRRRSSSDNDEEAPGNPVEGAGGAEEVEGPWQSARCKAEIVRHPLYKQLLEAHVGCLRVSTPTDQQPRIDAQVVQSPTIVAKYSETVAGTSSGHDEELDLFMAHYVMLLSSFKEHLRQHFQVHGMEALMACGELGKCLKNLTGVSPGEGTGATMSDNEEVPTDTDIDMFDASLEADEGFGLPTESERCLMERVREELKHELKQGFKEKIVDIRDEILRKRRAGKLPGDSTSLLKAWWKSHSDWPYPTVEDKASLMQQTGLELKQINNWFINQRKRTNWNKNSSPPTTSTNIANKKGNT